MKNVKKVVLAYSGGLDTSVILKWLDRELRLRGDRLLRRPRAGGGARAASATRRRKTGASKVYIEDLHEEFVRDFVFPMLRAERHLRGAATSSAPPSPAR